MIDTPYPMEVDTPYYSVEMNTLHTSEHCPRKVHEKPLPVVVVNKDGFTTVTNRKSKGKGAATSQKKNFGGFRVNYSKNFVYQPVKPKETDPKPNNSFTSDLNMFGKKDTNKDNSNGI
ncbi:hypothetical protein Tco_0571226 [Tanacetum coccineum]